MNWLRWIFWCAVYLVRRRPADLDAWLLYAVRTRSPWWVFCPSVYWNDDGNQWHVVLSDESSYTRSRQMLQVDLHIGHESGRIVGLNIWDESLRAAEAAKELTR